MFEKLLSAKSSDATNAKNELVQAAQRNPYPKKTATGNNTSADLHDYISGSVCQILYQIIDIFMTRRGIFRCKMSFVTPPTPPKKIPMVH